jgi:hypothetical protein
MYSRLVFSSHLIYFTFFNLFFFSNFFPLSVLFQVLFQVGYRWCRPQALWPLKGWFEFTATGRDAVQVEAGKVANMVTVVAWERL